MQENEENNKRVMEQRNIRLEKEMEETKLKIASQLQAKEEVS